MEWPTVLSAFFGSALGVIASLLSARLTARIASQFWIAEQRWVLKRETYVSLVKALYQVRACVDDAHYLLAQREKGVAVNHDEVSALIQGPIAGGIRAIKELRVVGALWLRQETLAALDEVVKKMREAEFKDPQLPVAINGAVDRVIAEAKHDLRLDV